VSDDDAAHYQAENGHDRGGPHDETPS
jgi:hypothetical protein